LLELGEDPAVDAELRAIKAALPHYQEAFALEVAKRAEGEVHRRRDPQK
jgi:hypothetical protein